MTRASTTKRQADLLAFIRAYLSEHDNVGPSFEEMAAGIGLKGKSAIMRLVDGLVERGLLERIPHKARALRLVRQYRTDPDFRDGYDAGWRACAKHYGIYQRPLDATPSETRAQPPARHLKAADCSPPATGGLPFIPARQA